MTDLDHTAPRTVHEAAAEILAEAIRSGEGPDFIVLVEDPQALPIKYAYGPLPEGEALAYLDELQKQFTKDGASDIVLTLVTLEPAD